MGINATKTTTTKDKNVYLFLILYPRNCKGNHMSLDMNMDDVTIFDSDIKLKGVSSAT